jgi:hypothetical protein
VVAPPTIFEYPPLAPGINTQNAPTVTAPTFPATTVAVTNGTGLDVVAYITNGAASMGTIKVNNINLGLTVVATNGNATIYLPAGASFVCTYASGSPTWVWVAA